MSKVQILKSEADKVQIEYDRFWRSGGDNFTSLLFRLMIKADPSNSFRLAAAYPVEMYVVSKMHEKPALKLFELVEDQSNE